MNKKIVNYKICLVGNSGVGKSSLVRRYIHNQFESYNEATIGAAFFSKDINYPNYILKLQIWDTAGQERYRSLGPLYFRGCGSIILVINGSDKLSLDSCYSWVQQIRTENPDIYIILAINKSDLNIDITESQIQETCQNYGNMDYIHVSAKSGDNIEKLFKMSFQKHQPIENKVDVVELSSTLELKKKSNLHWCSII